jgi:hypothetical protein
MYLSGSGKISKSMNGLLKINASDIDTTNASITNINNVENISGAIGSDLVIDVDTGKIIQLKDNTQIDSDLNVIGNIDAGYLNVTNSSIFNTSTHSGIATFNNNVIGNSNVSASSFNVTNASIFNGSITCKQITSNGVCNFNNPVLTNSSLIARSIDASNTSVFRSNLNVLGPINCTQNVTFDKDLVLTSSANQFSVFCSSSTFDGSLNVKGVLDVSRNSIFRNDLDVSGNLYVGKNNPNTTSTIDLTGQFLLREPSNPNVLNMSIKYEPTLAGWRFINNQAGGFVYFSVKNSAGSIRNFQFSFGQLYSNINSYYDCDVNFSFNKQLTLGDTNFAGTWFGVSHKYIPSVQPHDGYVVYNKGLNNNVAYYTNFTHNNLSNVEVPTFRMNHDNIWSKVPHTMESTLTLTGNVIANSVSVTPTEISRLTGASANIQAQINNLQTVGTRTTSILTATTNLVTNTIFNCGSITLNAGTYILSINAYVDVITATVSVSGLTGAYSTSATAFSQVEQTARMDGGGFAYVIGSAWSLNSSNTIVIASTTTYYMLVRVVFGTAARVRFVNSNSSFVATRLK